MHCNKFPKGLSPMSGMLNGTVKASTRLEGQSADKTDHKRAKMNGDDELEVFNKRAEVYSNYNKGIIKIQDKSSKSLPVDDAYECIDDGNEDGNKNSDTYADFNKEPLNLSNNFQTNLNTKIEKYKEYMHITDQFWIEELDGLSKLTNEICGCEKNADLSPFQVLANDVKDSAGEDSNYSKLFGTICKMVEKTDDLNCFRDALPILNAIKNDKVLDQKEKEEVMNEIAKDTIITAYKKGNSKVSTEIQNTIIRLQFIFVNKLTEKIAQNFKNNNIGENLANIKQTLKKLPNIEKQQNNDCLSTSTKYGVVEISNRKFKITDQTGKTYTIDIFGNEDDLPQTNVELKATPKPEKNMEDNIESSQKLEEKEDPYKTFKDTLSNKFATNDLDNFKEENSKEFYTSNRNNFRILAAENLSEPNDIISCLQDNEPESINVLDNSLKNDDDYTSQKSQKTAQPTSPNGGNRSNSFFSSFIKFLNSIFGN